LLHNMEILPKDFNKNIRELSEWLDKWRVERFGSDSLNPERYYKVTKDDRYLYGVAEGESLNDEKAKCDKVRDLLLSIKQINDKLSGKGLSQHLQWKEREQLKRERETLYKDYLEEVQTEPEPQRAMPEELNTEDAKELLDRLYKAGYIKIEKGAYIWTSTTVLCAYFADRASHSLNLSDTMDKEGNITTSWKPFEILFGFKKGSLKTAKQNWMRLNTRFEPTGFEGVAKIFEPER